MWVSTMYQVTTGVDDDLQAKPILEGEKVLQLLDPSMGSEVDHDQLEQMVIDKNGEKKWKRVEVNLKDHVKVPVLPAKMSLEFYDEAFSDYLSKTGMEQLPEDRPMWEIHMFKYPTSTAAGNIIFKLHHALGDGYSLMGALLSCLQRADNPSLPLTFPSRQSMSKMDGEGGRGIFKFVPRIFSGVINTMLDFGGSILKSTVAKDDLTPIRPTDDGAALQPMAITSVTFSLDHIKQIKCSLSVTRSLLCDEISDLETDEVNASKEYSLTLAAKIFSSKAFNAKAVQTVLHKAWNPSKGMKIQPHSDNTYSFSFKHEWDRKRVLDSRPWSVMSSHLVVRDWPPHLTLEELDFSHSPFWVRISGLPPNMMSKANAEKLGSKLGKDLSSGFSSGFWRRPNRELYLGNRKYQADLLE
ncbi:hypothetical protein RJ640_029233 [Escallonia rubra]|uniref:diacylglycerol O-acyltransferase n=1 Tax=Escallonia rubra TaxID=112253 RepID=A0AA88U651_9ASTE|nr:hypothetical protein RJ640_029233 [Escallonia rubra]